jgi:hypothetical protein
VVSGLLSDNGRLFNNPKVMEEWPTIHPKSGNYGWLPRCYSFFCEWLPLNPPNTMHAEVNAGDKPIEVIVVELKHEK